MSQTPSKVQTTDSRHDRGCNHEQVARYRNASEKWPGLEYVSKDGACQHSWPKGEEESMEHSKEDESPFDFSEDSPPALHKEVSKTHMEARRGRTDMIHGARV